MLPMSSEKSVTHVFGTDPMNYWLGREDSNLRMAEPKSAALPLGYAPTGKLPSTRKIAGFQGRQPRRGRTCAIAPKSAPEPRGRPRFPLSPEPHSDRSLALTGLKH